MSQAETWWTVAEVAARLRVSADSVERLLKAGDLIGRKVGGQWRIHAAALEEFESAGIPKARRAAAKFRTVPDVLGRRKARV